MTYQPWPFEPTKKLHDLFQAKFGRVWSNILIEESDIVFYYIDSFNKSWLYTSKNEIEAEDYAKVGLLLPALTFSAFCEFVDEVFEPKLITAKIPMYSVLIADEVTSNIIEKNMIYVNDHIKHFAIDNWSEPEKVIEEVKKYL